MRSLKFAEAIREATDQALAADLSTFLIGLGVPDPKGIFGTTSGLLEKYGPERVLDMPVAENGMTGIAIGAAIAGMRPLMTHQRADFALLALDQIVNNAAKWRFMFADQMQVPLLIRLIVGRGWGQGPQHSQSLQSLFAAIPGLKVVAPSNPHDAKGLLLSAVKENDPVIYLEHRWLHNIHGPVPAEAYTIPLGKAKVVREGSQVTVVASSHMTLEAWKALSLVTDIDVELIDLRTIKPLDTETIIASVKKTGRLLVADGDWKTAGIASEIVALASEHCFDELKKAPVRITFPDAHTPTSWSLANHYYRDSYDIAIALLQLFGRFDEAHVLHSLMMNKRAEKPLDIPDATFTGPF